MTYRKKAKKSLWNAQVKMSNKFYITVVICCMCLYENKAEYMSNDLHGSIKRDFLSLWKIQQNYHL